MLIIFIPVASPNDMDIRLVTCQNFDEQKCLTYRQKNDRHYHENSEIVWLNELQIVDLFSERPAIRMFPKVRRFIYSCTQLSKNILVMKAILRSVITDIPQEYTLEDLYESYPKEAFSEVQILNPRLMEEIKGTIINEAVAVTHRLARAVHLTC